MEVLLELELEKPSCVCFDADVSFSEYIQKTYTACPLKMCDLHRIRQKLTHEVAALVANILVINYLYHGNFWFRGMACLKQHQLQSIQKTLSRIVTNHRMYAHVKPILSNVNYHKLITAACSKTQHRFAKLLMVPHFHLSLYRSVKHFVHSFDFDLPDNECNATFIASFRKMLKAQTTVTLPFSLLQPGYVITFTDEA